MDAVAFVFLLEGSTFLRFSLQELHDLAAESVVKLVQSLKKMLHMDEGTGKLRYLLDQPVIGQIPP